MISSDFLIFELLVSYKSFSFKVCQGITLHSRSQSTKEQNTFTQNEENRKEWGGKDDKGWQKAL